MARRPQPIPLGVGHKYAQMVEGLRLLRIMATQPLGVDDATQIYGLHRRTFYRYLHAFKLAGIPVQVRYPKTGHGKEFYLTKAAWAQMIK